MRGRHPNLRSGRHRSPACTASPVRSLKAMVADPRLFSDLCLAGRPGRPTLACAVRACRPLRRSSCAQAGCPPPVGALPCCPGHLEERGQALEARLGQEAPQPRAPSSPSPEARGGRGWSRAASESRSRARSADGPPTIDTQGPSTSVSPSGVRTSNPLASRWQESRHRPSPLGGRRPAPGAGQFLEGAAQRVAGPRGVLEQQRTALRLPERVAQRLATRARDSSWGPPRSSRGAARRRRRRSHRPSAGSARGRPATSPGCRIVRSGVEEVDRVDHDGADRPVLHQLRKAATSSAFQRVGRHIRGDWLNT